MRMTPPHDPAIFWPMIGHFLLVSIVYVLLGIRRADAVKAGSARISQFRENRDEPAESLFVRNNLENQFELPVLFHITCLALYVTGGATLPAVLLAWIFVASRYVHAWIHITSNRIRYRQPAFMVGVLMTVLMWALLAYHLAVG
jgi:hypothetical protein